MGEVARGMLLYGRFYYAIYAPARSTLCSPPRPRLAHKPGRLGK
jgi:hypothetical protein